MSDDGRVITGSSYDGSIGRWVRWIDGVLEPMGYPGEADDVSGDGSVVVGLVGPAGTARWTESGGLELLGIPSEGIGSRPRISADGSVIVGWGNLISGSHLASALRWDESGATALGSFAGDSAATGVSGDGSLVVGWGRSEPLADARAFLWDEANGTRDLESVLGSDYDLPDAFDDFENIRASGISDSGRYIVGWASYYVPGEPSSRAFGWRIDLVPEPGTALLLGFGLVLLTRLSRERTRD